MEDRAAKKERGAGILRREATQKATPVVRDQQYVLEAIRAHCRKIGMVFDQTGRVEKIEENLVSAVSDSKAFIQELERGQGGELKVVRGQRPKFHSIHSSACLCVNSFALIQAHPQQAKFLGFESFSVVRFEQKLPTGISTPNIDLYLENDRVIIGVESKYTETLKPALPNWADSKTGIGNLQKYIDRLSEISVVPEGFEDGILRHYVGVKEEFHLDVAQLIKHTLGLLPRAKELGKRPILAYIYWEPLNHLKFESFRRHSQELTDFQSRIVRFIDFRALSYPELWKQLEAEPLCRVCIGELRKRYEIEVVQR